MIRTPLPLLHKSTLGTLPTPTTISLSCNRNPCLDILPTNHLSMRTYRSWSGYTRLCQMCCRPLVSQFDSNVKGSPDGAHNSACVLSPSTRRLIISHPSLLVQNIYQLCRFSFRSSILRSCSNFYCKEDCYGFAYRLLPWLLLLSPPALLISPHQLEVVL